MDTVAVIENVLEHYGVKGMKWGVRRNKSSSVTVADKGKKLKTSGGHGLPAHSDAVRARTVGQKGKASGLKSLSNEELAEYAKRLNMEQNVKRLQYQDSSPPKKFVLSLLGRTGSRQADEVANGLAAKGVAKAARLATGRR